MLLMHSPGLSPRHYIMFADLMQKKNKAKHMAAISKFAALFSPRQSSSFQPQKKNGATPDIFHRERSGFSKSIPAPHNGSFWGMGGCLRRNNTDTFLRWRAAPSLTWQDISPETTFIWAQSSLYVTSLTRTQISLSYELLFPRDRPCSASVFCEGQIAVHNVTRWR